MPHVVAQAILPAGGEARLVAPAEGGRYRLFERGGSAAQVEIVDDPAAPAELDVKLPSQDALKLRTDGVLVVRDGVNEAGDDRHVKLERASWPRQAATAGDVASLPGFRRHFSSEVLRADVSLEVKRVAVLFSDLTASTQLYANVGDAAALKLVYDHFDIVRGALEEHGGAVVKTIGDAVMAVFPDDMAGLRAGLAVLDRWPTWAAGHPHRGMTHIKLGLFAGSSFLVGANGLLDYFGQTVNIAARLQAQAQSGELVIAAELTDAATSAGVLDKARVHERWQAALKGVDGLIEASRIR
jgi:class 3 adenylate cyclase